MRKIYLSIPLITGLLLTSQPSSFASASTSDAGSGSKSAPAIVNLMSSSQGGKSNIPTNTSNYKSTKSLTILPPIIPSPAPGPKPLPTTGRVDISYVVGKDLEPGYYVQFQNDNTKSCDYSVIHEYKDNGVNKKIGGAGNTLLNNGFTASHATLTLMLSKGDKITFGQCEAKYIAPLVIPQPWIIKYDNIIYPGSYIVGVNIKTGSYKTANETYGCRFSYATKDTPVKSNLLYGTEYQPNSMSSVKGIVTIPSNASAVYFTVGCIKLTQL